MKLMKWKFWVGENKNSLRSSRLPKPKGLPERVGFYLLTQLKLDPDWVWSLKAVVRPTRTSQILDIRIFDPKEADISDVLVADFNSLDHCPEMILFEGCFNKNTGSVDIRRAASKAA